MAGGRRQLGYQLHESTQRALCRLAFLLVGLAPLLLCSLFSIAQYLPSYQRWRAEQVENWLASQLGVDVHVAAMKNKSPTRYALLGVRLNHPESGAAIGRVRQIEVEMKGGKCFVNLHEPELEGRQLSATWRIIHDWFLCRPQRYAQVAEIDMEKLTIRGLAEGDTFNDVLVNILPSEEALLLEIKFQLTDSLLPQASSVSQLIIRRDHRENQLMTDLQLRTGSPLPCSLIAGLVPQVAQLGEHATFGGVLDFHMRDMAWETVLTKASLQQLDFGLMSQDSGAGITAMGRIDLEQAVITDHQLKYANGNMRLGPGRISANLLHAIGEHLDVELRTTNPVDLHAFDGAGLYFCLQPEGLQVVGGLGPNSDAIFTDRLGGLARRPQTKRNELISLARVIGVLNASSADGNAGDTLSPSARRALRWLPIEAPPQRTATLLQNAQVE